MAIGPCGTCKWYKMWRDDNEPFDRTVYRVASDLPDLTSREIGAGVTVGECWYMPPVVDTGARPVTFSHRGCSNWLEDI